MCDRVDTARQSIADGWVSLKRGGGGGGGVYYYRIPGSSFAVVIAWKSQLCISLVVIVVS